MSLDYKFSVQQVIAEGRTTRENVDIIQHWLIHLRVKSVPRKLQEELIVLFLTALDNDINVTKSSIIAYYKLREEAPDIFDDRNIDKEDLLAAIRTMAMILIPTRTSTNDVILLFKLNDSDHRNFNIVAKMKVCYMIMDLTYHGSPPNGLLLVVDMEKFGFKHLSRLKIDALKKFLTFVQEALPLKLTSFHFLNSTFVLRTFWSMTKVFIKDDVLTKIFLHETNCKQEQLFKLIPRECLPENYGGTLPDVSILQALTLQKLRANLQFYNEEEALRKNIPFVT